MTTLLSLPWLNDAPSLIVVVGTLVVTIGVYSALRPRTPAHLQYAHVHGLTNIKLAQPLPHSHWLFGDALELARNASRFPDWLYDKIIESREQPHVRRTPFQPDKIIIASPALVEDVLKTQHDVFLKGEQMQMLLSDLIGRAFSMQDGHAWLHQRKIASKFFSAKMYREVATKMITKHAHRLCGILNDAVHNCDHVNLTQLFHEFTLQTFAELGFGLDMDLIGKGDSHPFNTALEFAFPQVLYRLQRPVWFWKLQRFLHVGSERVYAEKTKYIRATVADMVHKSMQQTAADGSRTEAATMVELFVQASQDGELGITPDIICDVAIAFAIAGRDTTADTLNWLFLMLARNPQVEHKLREELLDKVPRLMNGEVSMITIDEAQTLTYMEAVIKETLRLYPSVPASQRQASRDTHLVDGTFVAKGTTVSIPVYAIGRLTSVWGKDAMAFRPDRFLDSSGKLVKVSSFQFASFHAGPRICLGMNLAMLEIKLLVAMLLSRFCLDVAPNDGSYKFSASLPLKNPLMASVRAVQRAAAPS